MKNKTKYYDPSIILNKKDLDDKEPCIYLITTNRSAGKTTSFLLKALKDFKEENKKTILLYRYSYELKGSCDIFKDVLRMYSEYGENMKCIAHAKGLFYELFLDDVSFGYSISLNNPDALKKYSPLFSDVSQIIFDEFQTETGKYLAKEVEKFQSIYLTIARGGGSQSRDVKVFMLGNMVSVMNPYFLQFGIHKRLKSDTKFLRGNGWIAEFGYNESSSKAIQENGFFRAFSNEKYMSYSTEKKYLFNTDTFIEKPSGRSTYICTIIYEGMYLGVRRYYDEGIIHVSKKYDKSFKTVLAFKVQDHTQNTMMFDKFSFTFDIIRKAFKNGYLRFDDLKTKSAILDIIGVDLYN